MVFGGDVLFNGSVGRTDLPGGDAATLMAIDPVAVPLAPRLDRGPQRPRARDDDRGGAADQSVPHGSATGLGDGGGRPVRPAETGRDGRPPALACNRCGFEVPLARCGAARIPAPTAEPSTRSGTALTDTTAGGMLGSRGDRLGGRARLARHLTHRPSRRGSGPAAELGVLDITEFFGETTGGVRTYLLQKARYVQRRPALRQTIVVPGARDEILEASGVRCYRLHGPSVPTQKPYRFMLATRSTSRIVAHERPDLIEVGSAWFAPWLVHLATRRMDVPVVWFYHSNFPRIIAPWPERAGRARRAGGRVRLAVRAPAGPDGAGDARPVGLRGPRARARRGRAGGPGLPRRGSRAVPPATARRTPRGPAGGTGSPRGRWRSTSDGWRGRRSSTCCSPPGPRWSGGPARGWCWWGMDPRGGASSGMRRQRSGCTGSPTSRTATRLADLLAAVDLYVCPCSIETFGLSALEALASGTPLLSADRGGVAETVARSGAGAVFVSGDPGRWPKQAERLLRGDLAAPGRGGPALRRGAPRLGRRARPHLRRLPRASSPGEPARLHPRRHAGARLRHHAPVDALRGRGVSARRSSWYPTGTASGRSSRIRSFAAWLRDRAAEGPRSCCTASDTTRSDCPGAWATASAPGAGRPAKASS